MRDWRPYKATKAQALAFFEEEEVVTIRSLMEEFDYTFYGAQSRIYLLWKEGLIERLIQKGSWGLTTKGARRIMAYEQQRRETTQTEKEAGSSH